jgi:hypothetical protein
MSSAHAKVTSPKPRRFIIEPLEDRVMPTGAVLMPGHHHGHRGNPFQSQFQSQFQFQSQSQTQFQSLSISISVSSFSFSMSQGITRISAVA